VAAPRDLVLLGTVSELSGFVISSVLSLVLFLVSLASFHLAETRIAERI